MASHSRELMLTRVLPALTLRLASVRSCALIFLVSAGSMFGFAALRMLYCVLAMIWACLSRGRFLMASVNLAPRDLTSGAYIFRADSEYGVFFTETYSRRASF